MARFSARVQTGPGVHPASCTVGNGSFRGVKSGQGVTLTTHPLLVPWSRKSIVRPLPPLWAVRPVESLGACTRVCFTFSFNFGARLATGWTVRGSNPVWGENFRTCLALGSTQPTCKVGTVSFQGEERPECDADPLTPSSAVVKKE